MKKLLAILLVFLFALGCVSQGEQVKTETDLEPVVEVQKDSSDLDAILSYVNSDIEGIYEDKYVEAKKKAIEDELSKDLFDMENGYLVHGYVYEYGEGETLSETKLSGASVMIEDSFFGQTDADGYFEILVDHSCLESDSCSFRVWKSGYEESEFEARAKTGKTRYIFVGVGKLES